MKTENFIAFVTEGNLKSKSAAIFRVRNGYESQKANIGGVLRVYGLDGIRVEMGLESYIELVQQARKYIFKNWDEVVNFIRLMTENDSPFKTEAVLSFVATFCCLATAPRYLGDLSVNEINWLLGVKYVNSRSNGEYALWIDDELAWIGSFLDEEFYNKIVESNKIKSVLFEKMVTPRTNVKN